MNGIGGRTTIDELFEGKTVIVGVGNVLRGDDGLGPLLVERLRKKLDVPCINAESSLDRYVGKIARERPDTVLLIDAVDLGEERGALEIMHPEDVIDTRTSTHDLTPRTATDMLRRMMDGKLYLLGVQPANMQIGEGFSRRIKKTVRYLERRITRAVKRRAVERE